MRIIYKNKKLKEQILDASLMDKQFGKGINKNIEKCLKTLSAAKNIGEIQMLAPSMKIEKKKGSKNIGKFRVNKSIRMEFIYNNNEDFLQIIIINIIKIHNHKYQKFKIKTSWVK